MVILHVWDGHNSSIGYATAVVMVMEANYDIIDSRKNTQCGHLQQFTVMTYLEDITMRLV